MTTVVPAILMLFAAVVLVRPLRSMTAAMPAASAASAAGTIVIIYQIWAQFRHHKGPQPQPVSATPVVAE